MGADSSAKNTPNVPEFICPICLPKPKSSGNEKMLNWASVVRAYMYTTEKCKYTAIMMIPQPL